MSLYLCAAIYLHDSIAPGVVAASLTTNPASPSSDPRPYVKGTVDAGADTSLMTVNIYKTACSGSPDVSGSATSFALTSSGIQLPANTVATNGQTSLLVEAVDQAGNKSNCAPLAYAHDDVAPPAPSTISSTPPTPSSATSLNLKGNCELNSTVNVYTSFCRGASAGSGACATFDGGAGIAVTASTNDVTRFYVDQVDQAGNQSGSCTTFDFRHDNVPPTFAGEGTTRAVPNTNDKVEVTWDAASDPGGIGAVLQVATGISHTCALMADGTVRCWGYNWQFQLGTDAGTESRTPVAVAGIVNATRIAAGGSHTCVVLSDGTAKCWGDGANGRLGIGSIVYSSPLPVTPIGLGSGVIAIGTGAKHSCAVLSDGKAKCWGYNFEGQLGDGTKSARYSPVDVDGSVYKAIACGGSHACAIKGNGSVECWGDNSLGQLGDNSLSERLNPVTVKTIGGGSFGDVTSLSVGEYSSCAVGKGLTYCWGNNSFGEMEESSPGYRNGAKLIDAGAASDDTIQVAASNGNHACRLRANGRVHCWGDNFFGQIGSGSTSSGTCQQL